MNANLAFQVCGIGETAYLYYYMAQFPVGDLSLFKKKSFRLVAQMGGAQGGVFLLTSTPCPHSSG